MGTSAGRPIFRGSLLKLGGAFAAFAVTRGRAKAAQFEYKFSHSYTTENPGHVRSIQLWKEVERETNGRLVVKVFPDSILGTNLAVANQIRLGAIQLGQLGSGALQGLVPAIGITGIGFAYDTNAAAIAAIDGALGDAVRREIEAKGFLIPAKFTLENGLRQLTNSVKPIQSAADLAGLKLRVLPGRVAVDLFRTLGAVPLALDFSEAYSALQTHLVDGTELPVSSIADQRVYEVQKYLSIVNQSWSGSWVVWSPDAWKALPSNIQSTTQRLMQKYLAMQRHDIAIQEPTMIDKIHRLGMQVNHAGPQTFRAKLPAYYARWKAEFGPTLWGLLEQASGSKLG